VPAEYEVRILTKSGETRWVDFAAGNIEFEGRPAVLGTAVDITEHKRAAEVLRESEERFRGTFEQAAVGIAHVGPDGRWLRMNARLCDIVGYTESELLARTFQDITHPDDLDADLEYVRQMLDGSIHTYSMEKRYIRKNGSQVWINLTVSLVREPSGRPKYFISVVQDIEARKRAQAALWRAHEELEARVVERTADLAAANRALQEQILERQRAEEELVLLNQRRLDLLESITDGFFALDRDGRFTYVNPGAARLLSVQRQELLGKNIWELFPQAMGTPFYTQYQRAVSEQAALDTEAYYAPLNRWFKAHAYPWREGFSVLFEDVTERHEWEVRATSDILRALNARLRVEEAFPDVAAGLRAIASCDGSILTLFDQDYETAIVVGVDQPALDVAAGSRLRAGDIPAIADVVAGRAHAVPDLAVEAHSPIVQRLYAAGFRSALCVPLHESDRVSGMLTLTWRKLDGPSSVHLPLLGQITDAVALAVEKERLFDQVRSGHERLQALSHRLIEVQETERRHIARELHDEIGQLLTALKLTLDTIDGIPAGPAVSRLHDAQHLVNDLVTRVRDLSLDLRPAMLDDLGLLPALLWLFGRYSTQMNVQVRFEHTGLDRRFPSDIETAAYRIVQEALTNVARHAGVSEATVRVWTDDHALNVQVADLGRGFDLDTAEHAGRTGGLSGLQERGLLLGGQLTVESAPERGTRINAELPLEGRSRSTHA